MSGLMRHSFRLLIIAAVMAYASICGAMWYKQRAFLFTNKNRHISFESLRLEDTKLHWLPSTDGAVLETFYHPAPKNRPTILYFHGKGTEISNEANALKVLAAKDFGFLAISYRGYGKSSGQPSEAGLIDDARTAYEWLRQNGVSEKQIFVLGLSLGTGVAVQLAAQKSVAGVALGAPYTSTADVAAERYWYLPIHYLMTDQFLSSHFISKVTAPLFILHGINDKTVPMQYGKKLFELAHEPKQIKLVEGQGHPLIFQKQSMEDYAAFFDSVYAKNPAVE